MSFCFDVKNDLAGIRPPQRVKPSLVYGFLLFGRSFSYHKIGIQTANAEMAEYYLHLLREVYGVDTSVAVGGRERPTYRVQVPSEADRLRILASFDYGIYEGPINEAFLSDPACEAAFVRGAFLSCGNLSDPEREYRADFSVRDRALAEALLSVLERHEIHGFVSPRGTGWVLVVRRSETVINLMTLMGASDRSLEIIETTMEKGLSNQINRARNCDSGNISKTVEASIAQRRAIEFLQETGRLETLPETLYAVARLRLDYPQATLSELCRQSAEPLTVSGLNHRLHKLMELAEEYRKS